MKNKQVFFAIITGLLALIVLLSAILLTKKPTVLSPSPTPTPQQSQFPAISGFPQASGFIPPDLNEEKVKQESYAKERENYLNTHPWILKFPLKSSSYFISFDSENEQFLATIYYSNQSSQSKEEQLSQAKTNTLNALTAVGVDTNKAVIVYTETNRK